MVDNLLIMTVVGVGVLLAPIYFPSSYMAGLCPGLFQRHLISLI